VINVNKRRRAADLCRSALKLERRRLSWPCPALRTAAMIVGLGGATGCGTYAITATNGSVFTNGDARGELTSALLASASRDLDCTSVLEVRRLDAERQYEVSGCGFTAVYAVETPSIRARRIELVSSDRPGQTEKRVASISKPEAIGAMSARAR
jgi:hypothetical protein